MLKSFDFMEAQISDINRASGMTSGFTLQLEILIRLLYQSHF
jgi:hypothetical protein